MQIKIYQINADRDKQRVKFLDLKSVKKIDPSIYDEVFCGDVDCNDLEEVFRKFNQEGHPLHRGHSLSVSDVVVVEGDVPEPVGAYSCDSVGFEKVDFDESLTQKPENLMKIVYVEPNRRPFVSEIPHTLDAEQKAVCGFIEPIYNDDDTCLVGNEEAKLIGMKGNRRLGDGYSIIAGPFFVVGLTEDDFRSLTDDEVKKYMDRFAEPENISQEDVEADTGFHIITF